MSNEDIFDTLDVVLQAAEAAKSRAEHIIHKDQIDGNFESETLFDAICMNFNCNDDVTAEEMVIMAIRLAKNITKEVFIWP